MAPTSLADAGKPGKPRAPAGARRKPPTGDPSRELFKKTTLCRFYSTRNGCERGGACPFAHGADEMRSKPDLTKTSLCKLWAKGRCPSKSWQCPWAHGRHELQGIRTEAGEIDASDLALAEYPSEAGHKEDDVEEKTTGGRSKSDVTVDILIEALAGGTSTSSDDESLGKKPTAPQTTKECPRCNIGGHVSTARFCVQCGYALVESGPAQSQEWTSGTPVAAIPVVFGEPGAAVQGPWQMGVCAPGPVIMVPAAPQAQGWMVMPPASFAQSDMPVMGALTDCGPCPYTWESAAGPAVPV